MPWENEPKNVLTRMDRYCVALPDDEPIPISDSERFSLIALTVSATDEKRERQLMGMALDSLNAGTFRYRGHRVIVL